MFQKVLIANRGEVAIRVARTLKEMGISSVAVYSEIDRDAPHVREADEAFLIGPAVPAESYLNIARIIDTARQAGAEAIHPGYGFLAENAEFARACAETGIVFIGPPPEAIEAMGSKTRAREIMAEAGVPIVPGATEPAADVEAARKQAEEAGYPVACKAAGGGGGKGFRVAMSADDLEEAFEGSAREGEKFFSDPRVYVERYLEDPRHVEVQVLADGHGNVIHLGERDCSVQRRHQKVVEEAPCPVMTPELRKAMGAAAVKAAASVNYVGAGTVEFLLDASGEFYFLEMNTRLQVEHPVTELITGQDLVAWQIRVAAGQPLPLKQDEIRLDGHAIEVRLYAEDAANNFLPQTGKVLRWEPELLDGVRIDHGLVEGQEVTPFYDPMLAKVIAHGATREDALRKLIRAVENCVLLGVNGNQRFLANLLGNPEFVAGRATTAFIAEHFSDDPSLKPQAPGARELAVAAALLYQASASSRAHDRGLAGWRSAGSAPWQFTLRQGEQKYPVALEVLADGPQPSLRARVGDTQLDLRLLASDGRWLTLELDGVRQRQAYHLGHERLWLYGHYGNLELLDVTHEPAGGQNAASSGAVKAPMDGAIVEVLVEEGARVTKGQLLVVLEAMKMEHPLKAGVDGVVRRVGVTRGDQVKNRQLLVEIEPEDA